MKKKTIAMVIILSVAGMFINSQLLAVDSGDAQTTETKISPASGENQAAEKGLRFNFKNAPIDGVLDYMSQAAGFAIIKETEVYGNVDAVSHQPLSPQEAVNFLNTVLNEKGYTAVQNGRILKIVERDKASKDNIPVKTGRDPGEIPNTDEMVTQILPVRYANAVKLLENIKPLLPDYAIVSANESSNAIILTDTQSHIRRMAEIILALDTSISQISTLKVFMLKYTDAVDVAKLINDVFKVEQTSERRSRRDFMPPFFGRSRGDRDRDSSSSEGDSQALRASSRVVAAADENTNAVVVSAPEEVMPTIEKLISEIDVTSQEITEVRVFTLKYADAEEMADMIEEIFEEQGRTTQARQPRSFFGRMMRDRSSNQQQTTQRKKEENKVIARADARTNSVVVSAASDTMVQVAQMILQLDANPAKEKKVYVYPLKNANAETVAEIMDEMFEEQSRQNSSGSRTNRSNTTRSTRNTSTRNTSRQSTR